MLWRFPDITTHMCRVGGLCFAYVSGGTLGDCSGRPSQQWQLRGSPGKQQIVSGTGFGCVTNGEPLQPPGALSFDFVTGLGWPAGALVRDLWAHTDLGVLLNITVALAQGNGTSRIFKLVSAPV